MTVNTQFAESIRDYSLVGEESRMAEERGLADATWYTSPIPREKMRELLVRRDGPAIRDTLIWFGLIFGSAYLVVLLWGTWFFILPYLLYAVLYASTSDSRWHEASHGTAFKSGWMNDLLYEIASFMVLRQSTVWRWSHTRHHSDTLVRGRDPEISAKTPPAIMKMILNLFGVMSASAEFRTIFIHASGKIDKEVATFLPESEYRKVIWKARIYLLIFSLVFASSILFATPFPVMFIGLPTLIGTWLMPVYGLTQHAGLEENVLDHRLNCRTVYMNRVHRFLYWNMNYHVEHHMFPLVPYHALPRLHELMKDDCPPAYKSILDVWREIIPTLRKQVKDPYYHAERKLPEGAGTGPVSQPYFSAALTDADSEGMVRICGTGDIPLHEVVRFDLDERTFAVYHTGDDQFFMTEGICTHGNTHLSDGLVIGEVVECPKHNGRFRISDGSPQRPPVCEALKTFEVVGRHGQLYANIDSLKSEESRTPVYEFRVVSNHNVATFIKELVLEPVNGGSGPEYQPGDYLKLEIPAHRTSFSKIEVDDPYRRVWKKKNTFRYHAFNPYRSLRNYSLASNPERDDQYRFNIRISLPPAGVNCDAGVGSSYIFSLKPGDSVKASGPFGDFHLTDSDREMVFVGGGAGMAPLRSQISWLFDSKFTERKASYWYGARSEGELFYEDYFNELASSHENFSFHVAFSEPAGEVPGGRYSGFIHEVLTTEFLEKEEGVQEKEYYLCGPPEMISAVRTVLEENGVPGSQVKFDEF